MALNAKQIYRVKSRFTEEELSGKRLRWYTEEYPSNYTLRVSDFDPADNRFVLWAVSWTLEPEAVIERTGKCERRQILQGEESLDQPTVDKIEVAPPVGALHGCDFVLFEESPISRAECVAKDQ